MNDEENLILLFGIHEISQIVQRIIEDKFNIHFETPELIVLVGLKVYNIRTQKELEKMIRESGKIAGKEISNLITKSIRDLEKKGILQINGEDIIVNDEATKIINETIKHLKIAKWFFLKTNEITKYGLTNYN